MSVDNIYKEGESIPEGKEVGDVINREVREYEKLSSAKRLNKKNQGETD
mgnify:FL=1|tara:strand:- start:260 stop:406 length:147 start_codon:yes stop_codon:yes gene_type:complete